MLKIIMGTLMLFAFQSGLQAETTPTLENTTKLYVATFNRAPDSGGLDYWATGAGLDLEGIAQSFFDQNETKEAYPADSTNVDFAEAVYQNLFNRAAEADGLIYWVAELDSGRIAKSTFILAVINGAQDTQEFGNDATILTNKTTVGLAFANAGLNDTTDAKEIMLEVTDDEATVTAALESYGISTTPLNLVTLLVGKTYYTAVENTYIENGVTIENNHVETLEFNNDGVSFHISWIQDGEIQNREYTYSVEGDVLTLNVGETITFTNVQQGDDYILFSTGGKFYTTEAAANTALIASDSIAITEAMLSGKTFYFEVQDEENGEIHYKSWEFSNGTLTFATVNPIVNNDREVGTTSYSIENEKILMENKPDVWMHIVLNNETATTWEIRAQSTTDVTDGRDMVLYLSKPAHYPAAL